MLQMLRNRSRASKIAAEIGQKNAQCEQARTRLVNTNTDGIDVRKERENEHQYGRNGCKKRKRKLCVQVFARCANCQGNHQANSIRYPSRPTAEIQARKNKAARNLESSIKVTKEVESDMKRVNSPAYDQDMDEGKE